MATTKTEYKLEKEDISNTSSTTVKIDMKEESSEDQLAVDEDIALVQASIMVMNENELGAQVFLMSFDGVFFTKVEGTARLYVNGKYIGSEDFKADPLIPVPSLQAATIIEYSDGFEVGDTVLMVRLIRRAMAAEIFTNLRRWKSSNCNVLPSRPYYAIPACSLLLTSL